MPLLGHTVKLGIFKNLGLSPIVKAIQLVEKLQHSSLDFSFPTTVALVPAQITFHIFSLKSAASQRFNSWRPFGANGVNLINEDDTWAVLICNSEQLAHLNVVGFNPDCKSHCGWI